MKEGWTETCLGRIATFRRGLTYSKNDEVNFSNNVVLRSNNIDLFTHQIIFDELKYLRDDFVIPADKYLKKGELLMCMSNGSKIHLGKIALATEDYNFAFGGFMAAVEHNECVSDKFLYYSLISSRFKEFIKKLSDGANINNIKVKDLEKYFISYPQSMAEQERIVSLLDAEFAKIDAIKANAEKQLKEAKALFQSALKDYLTPKEGWRCGVLGDYISHLRTGLNPRQHFKLNTEDAEGYYITVRELKGFEIITDNKTDRVNKDALERINRRSALKIGDILFSGTGTIGNTALVSELPTYWNIKEGIYAITPIHTIVDSKFLIYVLGADFFLNEARKKAEGTGVMSVPMKRFVKLKISVPTITEQKTIVHKLDKISAKIQSLQSNFDTTVTLCNDLKQSILKDIFG